MPGCDCIHADGCLESWRGIPCSQSYPLRKWKADQKRARKQAAREIEELNNEYRKETE